ncbi:hypothetical protein R6242_20130 [Iodobacter sp. CM08]|uniref:hypothetical protein n=1 Tax=Iodobacter sp. CM08 TaxID=3085902 RepID=UPI002980D385|nr:hypothetical protein [Iodobacter sp. CM08]MDW5418883.1 hypothetical protein [Iodobacter sp. CM08]
MYNGVAKIFKRYWCAYGGFKALRCSPYLHAAIFFTGCTWHFWAEPLWWDQVTSVLPNLLGFTLGGFAMFLGFGDEKFRAMLAEKDEDADPNNPSLYVSLCATFVHFIVVQILALFAALLAKASWFYVAWPDQLHTLMPWLNLIGGGMGYLLFLYSVTSVLAATMHMFRIATWYETHMESK